MMLDEIVGYKKSYLKESKKAISEYALLKKLATHSKTKKRDFKKALKKAKTLSLIAELKQASPSSGVIVKNYEPAKIARVYEKSGASCLSVLTDEKFFKGELLHIQMVKKETTLPVLRKDFIIDTYQILESALYGADAVLLIARILEEKTLRDCISICRDFDMTPMVEVHSKNDLDKAMSVNPDIIGINNRDLDTLEVDLKTTEKLIKFIPRGILKISESGISTHKDIGYLKSLDIDAVLIGEALLKSKDIKKKIKELFR